MSHQWGSSCVAGVYLVSLRQSFAVLSLQALQWGSKVLLTSYPHNIDNDQDGDKK